MQNSSLASFYVVDVTDTTIASRCRGKVETGVSWLLVAARPCDTNSYDVATDTTVLTWRLYNAWP